MTLNARDLGVVGRLQGVDLTVEPGQVVAVVGRNGAGKSTLLEACLGLVDASGEVTIAGKRVADLDTRERAEHLAWLPQESAPTEGLTVREVVEAARYRFSEPRSAARQAADAALTTLGLADHAGRLLHELSGGERQRVRMASLLAQEASTWLLDEPGNHLDPAAQIGLWQRLGNEAASGRAVLVVTHDITLLAALGDVPVRVLGLEAGLPAFLLDARDPGLSDALGALLCLHIETIEVEGIRRLVVVGAR